MAPSFLATLGDILSSLVGRTPGNKRKREEASVVAGEVTQPPKRRAPQQQAPCTPPPGQHPAELQGPETQQLLRHKAKVPDSGCHSPGAQPAQRRVPAFKHNHFLPRPSLVSPVQAHSPGNACAAHAAEQLSPQQLTPIDRLHTHIAQYQVEQYTPVQPSRFRPTGYHGPGSGSRTAPRQDTGWQPALLRREGIAKLALEDRGRTKAEVLPQQAPVAAGQSTSLPQQVARLRQSHLGVAGHSRISLRQAQGTGLAMAEDEYKAKVWLLHQQPPRAAFTPAQAARPVRQPPLLVSRTLAGSQGISALLEAAGTELPRQVAVAGQRSAAVSLPDAVEDSAEGAVSQQASQLAGVAEAAAMKANQRLNSSISLLNQRIDKVLAEPVSAEEKEEQERLRAEEHRLEVLQKIGKQQRSSWQPASRLPSAVESKPAGLPKLPERRTQRRPAPGPRQRAQFPPPEEEYGAEEEAVIDLLDSDDEAPEPAVSEQEDLQAPSSSQAPSTSEPSQVSEEEEALSSALQSVSVAEEEPAVSQRSKDLIPPLAARQRELHRRAMAPGEPSEVLVIHERAGIELTREHISALKPRVWLNDEVINMFMALLQDRDRRWRAEPPRGCPPPPKCHFFTSFFCNKLYLDKAVYCYKDVQRWSREPRLRAVGQPSKCLLDVDRVVMPVNLSQTHWTCACVDFRAREVVYYDSLHNDHRGLTKALFNWVRDEFKDKRGITEDMSRWTIRCPDDVPLQTNGCDCGVFAATNAEYLGRAAPFDYSQRHMERFRIKIAADLMAQHVD